MSSSGSNYHPALLDIFCERKPGIILKTSFFIDMCKILYNLHFGFLGISKTCRKSSILSELKILLNITNHSYKSKSYSFNVLLMVTEYVCIVKEKVQITHIFKN